MTPAVMTDGAANMLFWLGLTFVLFLFLCYIMAGGLERKR